MLTKKQRAALDFNQRLLCEELEKREVQIKVVPDTPFIEAKYGKHSELMFDVASLASSYTSSWIVSDKFYTKQVLKEVGIPVPEGKIFYPEFVDDAIAYAEQLGFPVVLKPVNDGHGNFVYADITSSEELRSKIEIFGSEYKKSAMFLLEKFIAGGEYRLFYTKNGFFAAVYREQAYVIGDGENSILNLIQIENFKRMNPRNTCLCQIKLDDVLFDYLDKQSITLDAVPKLGEKVRLRPNSNVSKGGHCTDVTDQVHPSFLTLARKVLQAIPGLSFVGIDVLCQDISKSLEKQPYAVCELNVAPGLSLHTLPAAGTSRDTPAAVVDVIFPETKEL